MLCYRWSACDANDGVENTEVAGLRTIHHLVVRLNAQTFATALNVVDSNVWFHKWRESLLSFFALSRNPSNWSMELVFVYRLPWCLMNVVRYKKTLCEQCKSTWTIFVNGIPTLATDKNRLQPEPFQCAFVLRSLHFSSRHFFIQQSLLQTYINCGWTILSPRHQCISVSQTHKYTRAHTHTRQLILSLRLCTDLWHKMCSQLFLMTFRSWFSVFYAALVFISILFSSASFFFAFASALFRNKR